MQKGIGNHVIGDTFDGFMLIKTATKGTASNGKQFLTLFFVDATGEIDAKLWDASKEDVETFTEEKVVKIVGDINEFRGKAQMRIKSIRPAQVTDGVRVSDFLEKSPIDKEMLQEQLMEAIFEMKNPNLQRIVRAFVKKYHEDLFIYPAASKNHHAFVSGLAYHIVTMLKVAKQLCLVYPELNKDLLYAGIILHDIGKLHELTGVVSTSYTMEGTLLGHISLMVTEIKQVADELNIDGEEVVILQHLVLSHHGKAEWGSPKPPLVREAEILHLIDQIDAKVNMLNRALDKTRPGEFTERLFAMDHRSFYKPTFENDE
ncbi:3'-5' exoribonuclease YhaM [Pseudogracilibacillus auburnensis]|uniref:3'-5' exoribonuclease n=1 Tax=Pseudogracilibacillus auburnensis TaxID=1494959 RepID=A0A2V3VYR6_9BACI|nr:3'-5' exoribonuclease YhaM [Pseudogracilibacillus auburnensis]MBO1002917.1 3'-5' exoribonuclease YhaM [Pseudogracilibacillus auburnensis]PXW87012.1 3'-5' exoribonuclease [Pseudogracilibacillus auburnensis]